MSSLISEKLVKLLKNEEATKKLYEKLISTEKKDKFEIENTNFTVKVDNFLDKKSK
ncbi:TPA: hypothetical protein KLD75_000170 [Legionella pneumophila]|nr:hypothetical protein [Legionella pneumophila]HCE5379516.1 hypothetical protein [Legionella pneumophila]HCE5476304.1 hypothetical protein [Legionella pneumophila]HCE5485170.1 hypothetical protein [Legionella pneumophila]HEE0245428.1 hypothetical protein [Legionella pneumophila]